MLTAAQKTSITQIAETYFPNDYTPSKTNSIREAAVFHDMEALSRGLAPNTLYYNDKTPVQAILRRKSLVSPFILGGLQSAFENKVMYLAATSFSNGINRVIAHKPSHVLNVTSVSVISQHSPVVTEWDGKLLVDATLPFKYEAKPEEKGLMPSLVYIGALISFTSAPL